MEKEIAEEISGKALEYAETIYRATENLLLAERLFEAMKYEGQICYRILLGDCKSRKLRSVFGRKWFPRYEYECSENEVEHGRQIEFDEFRSLWPEPCIDAIMEIFFLFNADEIPKPKVASIVISRLAPYTA